MSAGPISAAEAGGGRADALPTGPTPSVSTQSVFSRLQSQMARFTPSERVIANFILTNQDAIPFETGASLAKRLGVSAVTIGRFCRTLGHRNFRELKNALKREAREAPWLAGVEFRAFLDSYQKKSTVRHSLELQIANIVDVYRQAETREFEAIVELLAKSPRVQVVGLQTERGMAHVLVNHLQYIRDGVSFVDAASGNFAEIFAARDEGRCVVLIDARRYSRHARQVAERARRERIPLVMITDKSCDWARQYTPHVVMASTEVALFTSSSVATSCALNLLINGVVTKLGRAVEARLRRMSELYEEFTGFVGPDGRRR